MQWAELPADERRRRQALGRRYGELQKRNVALAAEAADAERKFDYVRQRLRELQRQQHQLAWQMQDVRVVVAGSSQRGGSRVAKAGCAAGATDAQKGEPDPSETPTPSASRAYVDAGPGPHGT